MQRHFSNRGEAIAEATAARTNARRKLAFKSAASPERRTALAQWIPQRLMPQATPAKKKGANPVAASDPGLPVL